jgi:diguanylate cyclase (GGDEF)-like protein
VPARSRVNMKAAVQGWAVWSESRTVFLAVLLLSVSAMVIGVTALQQEPLNLSAVATILVLLVLSAVFEFVTVRIQNLRRRLSPRPIATMNSVWAFAAAIALPPGQASVLVACLGLRHWFGRPAGNRGKAYRQLVTWSAVMIAVQAASGTRSALEPTLHSLPHNLAQSLAITVALVVYFFIDTTLLLGVRYLSIRPAPLRAALGSADDVGLEIATLCLGGMAGLCLLQLPWLIALVLPPMVLLQRGAFVKQLEQAATIDAKTGLLNAATWEQVAHRELARADREQTTLAILILDLDFFKRVNDRHGHLAGDAALMDVGRCLLRELRPYDIIGRFGGEEFVALLPDTDVPGAEQAAERIRAHIATVSIMPVAPPAGTDIPGGQTLSASIGIGVFPTHGTDLPTLLHRADAALYVAKRAGRNRVRVAGDDAAFDPAANDAAPTPPT